VELNLKKARKLEASIQKFLDKGFPTTINIRSTETLQGARKALEKASKEKAVELLERDKLLTIRYDIRRQIEAKNETSGINSLINEKVLLEKKIEQYGNITGKSPSDEELAADLKIASNTLGSNYVQKYIEVGVFNESFLNVILDEVHNHRKHIEIIEDKIAEKNLSNKVRLDAEQTKLLQAKRLL